MYTRGGSEHTTMASLNIQHGGSEHLYRHGAKKPRLPGGFAFNVATPWQVYKMANYKSQKAPELSLR